MKKLISVLLAVVMLFCCLSAVSAGAVYVENNHFETVYPELFELKGVEVSGDDTNIYTDLGEQ